MPSSVELDESITQLGLYIMVAKVSASGLLLKLILLLMNTTSDFDFSLVQICEISPFLGRN